LKQFSQEHKQKSALPIPYNPDASTDIIDNFMDCTLIEKEVVDLVYEIIGVSLFGYGYKYQVIFVFYGHGANGKGVIVKLIQRLIPREMCSSVPPSEWGKEYQRYPLYGSRFNSVGELPMLHKKDMETLKSISAGDTISVRKVGESGFEFSPIALHIFSTNNLTPLPESGEAIDRRFVVIQFNVIVPRDRRNPDEADDLYSLGSPGLLRRAVEGFQRVLDQNGFSNPASVQEVTDAWLKRVSPLKEFIDKHIEKTTDTNDKISSNDMFKSYKKYCNSVGYPPPSSARSIKAPLENLGFSNKKISSQQWLNVKFKE
jgi:putative DNA primase/helicase